MDGTVLKVALAAGGIGGAIVGGLLMSALEFGGWIVFAGMFIGFALGVVGIMALMKKVLK